MINQEHIHTKGISPEEEKLAKTYFISQGVAALVAWTVVLSTLDFYKEYFPEGEVEFILPASYSVTILVINSLMVYVKRILSVDARIPGCLLIQGIILIITPIIAYALAGTAAGYWIVVINVCLIGIIHQIPQASVIGLAGYLEPKYMALQFFGTGVGCIITNFIRVFTLLAFSSKKGSNLLEIFLYYSIAFGYLIWCMYLHRKFMKSKFARDYIIPKMEGSEKLKLVDYERVGLEPQSASLNVEESETEISKALDMVEPLKGNMLSELYTAFKMIQFYAILMLVAYVQTISFFPGIMLKRHVPDIDIAWKILLMELLFNIPDTIGKSMPLTTHKHKKTLIALMIVFRFLLCAVFIIQAVEYDIPIIGHLWFDFLTIALFGLTNGLATSTIFVLAPESVEGEYKEFSGFVLLTSLSVGIMLGSFGSISCNNLITYNLTVK